MAELVTYELDGHVATITYNRPEKLNAINGQMREQLNAAWLRFYEEEDAWIAIVTGAGRAFCVGADTREGGAAGSWPGTFWEIPTINSFESGLELWKPTIAAVGGYCLGYGLTAVSVCDFVVAADDAVFGFPEVLLGVPTIVGAIRMPPKIGWENAMELLLTGENFDAQRAKEMGICGRIVPREQLMDEARTLAARLLKGAPVAQRAIKEMAWRSRFLPWTESVRMGEAIRRLAGRTEDASEGGLARREGREPQWKGR